MTAFNRRSFISKASALSLTTMLASIAQPAWSRHLSKALDTAAGVPADQLASDEDFWYYIQQSYTVSPALINLNNGGVSPSPKAVQDAMKRYYDYCNETPSYYMWRVLDQGREPLRKNLARLAACNTEEYTGRGHHHVYQKLFLVVSVDSNTRKSHITYSGSHRAVENE